MSKIRPELIDELLKDYKNSIFARMNPKQMNISKLQKTRIQG